jgi:SAM-dependent methyltransferase
MDLIITTLFSLTALAWWGTVAAIFFACFLIFTLVRFLKGQTRLAISEAKKIAGLFGFPIDVKIFPKIAKRLKRQKVDVRNVYNRFIEEVYKRGIWFIRCEMAPYIKKGETFLDVGSGSGYLAKELEKRAGVKVTCVDVVDSGKTRILVVLFDGQKLPFSDQSFDTVMFSYVLHHAGHHQSELLKEAKRVAKKRVIVFEDEAVGGFGELFTSFHGLAYDFLYDLKNNNACVFHSALEWEKIFKKIGFKILAKEVGWTVGSIVCPVKRSFFVLGV